MRIKIIATIFICFYSYLGFSQAKKVIQYFERHSETLSMMMNKGGCWGMQYRHNKEDYAISLFSDSTFIISYSQTGNLFPKQHELATGKFFNRGDSMYLIRDSVISRLSKTSGDGGRLEEVLNYGIPLRIEYTNDCMLFYNSAGTFLTFGKENILNKYKNDKPLPLFSPVTYIPSSFSNNPMSF